MQSSCPADRVCHTAAVREESSDRGLDQEYATVGVGVEMWTSRAEQEDVEFDEEVPGVVPVCFGEGVDVSEWGDLGISLCQQLSDCLEFVDHCTYSIADNNVKTAKSFDCLVNDSLAFRDER